MGLRYRSAAYLKAIRGQPCLYCGAPGEAHHLTFAEKRAMGLKNGDNWTVPVCRTHHMELHNSPMPERTWWALNGIDPIKWAKDHYERWEKYSGN